MKTGIKRSTDKGCSSGVCEDYARVPAAADKVVDQRTAELTSRSKIWGFKTQLTIVVDVSEGCCDQSTSQGAE